VAAIEVLASRETIVEAMVGVGDGAEDEIDLVHQLGASQGEVKAGAGVEYDEAAIWVSCAGVICGHD
jgi:hypothetical protein